MAFHDKQIQEPYEEIWRLSSHPGVVCLNWPYIQPMNLGSDELGVQ